MEPEQMHTSLSLFQWERVCQQTLSSAPHFKTTVNTVMKCKKRTGETLANFVASLFFSVVILLTLILHPVPLFKEDVSEIPHSPDFDWQALKEALQMEWRRSWHKRKWPQNKQSDGNAMLCKPTGESTNDARRGNGRTFDLNNWVFQFLSVEVAYFPLSQVNIIWKQYNFTLFFWKSWLTSIDQWHELGAEQWKTDRGLICKSG